jgi:5-methylcytosine-specific restriction endonuclease McrA
MEAQDWIMTPQQQHKVRETIADLDSWLQRLFFFMGFESGMKAQEEREAWHGTVMLGGYDDELHGGKGRWSFYYGATYYVLTAPYGHPLARACEGFPFLDINRFQVWGRNARSADDGRFVALMAEMIERKVQQTFRKVEQANYLRLCSVDGCDSTQFYPFTVARSCVKIGDRWVCDECVGRFSLAAPSEVSPRKNRDKTEREKMSVSLRFDILARDGFRCAACGQRPTRENGVELDVRSLHIDHITPIARDGKTERDNLVTLCKDCNLGKSDKELSDELRAYFEAMTTG